MNKVTALLIDKEAFCEGALIESGVIKELHKVSDGKSTLKMLIRYYTGEIATPDLIILDASMVNESIAILKVFEQHSFLKHMVVVLTNDEHDADAVNTENEVLRYRLTKPINVKALESIIAKEFAHNDL